MAANKTRTRKDNFISKIVKDPASPPKTILLRGYLGDSSEEGHTRLYLDAQLNNYVEIPDDAILHEEDVAKDVSCGADPDRHAAAIARWADAGFDRIAIVALGDADRFFELWEQELRPRLDSIAVSG